jgi:hypothetical protein
LTGLLLASIALTYTNLTAFLPTSHRPSSHFADSEDPADSFKDNVWPIRDPAKSPWDISTDFPYPRLLQYRVSEGTWLRLDVHPTTGDVVFDMLGDIYCIPGQYVVDSQFVGEQAEARPVLQGIPYDADPHFSPSGDRIVFRSDAGHGLENIWVTQWTGCEAMDLRSTVHNPNLAHALQFKAEDEELFSQGLETEDRKHRRLIREGRAGGAHYILSF